MTQFTLGINLGFATNRWPEPEVWARLVANGSPLLVLEAMMVALILPRAGRVG